MTCLGDFVLRLGGWCKNCRLFVCLLEMTYELAFKTPPWKFLVYDKKLPVNFDCWPEVSRQTFDMREFEFGENDLTGETTE